MQKKVFAAVVGGLLATPAVFADSANVTISGRFAIGLESYKLSGGNPPNAAGYSNENRVSDQSSSIIFSGAEDLGGGLKAWFQIDERYSPDGSAATSLGATGNTQAGLSGGFGKLAIGRQDLHYQEISRLDATRAGSLQTILSDGPLSQVNGVTIANGTRTPNVIYWDSADLGGLTARVGYSTHWNAGTGSPVGNEVTGRNQAAPQNGSNDNAWTAALRYAAGPILAGASIWNAKEIGTAVTTATPAQVQQDQKSTRAWVGYNAAGLKIGLAYDSSQDKLVTASNPFTKRNAWEVPVSYAFGADTVYVSYAKMGKVSGPATTDDTDATAMMVGWDHALSKRTFVGAYYTTLDNKANATYDLFGIANSGNTNTNAGEDAKQIYLGFTHLF